MAMREMFLPIAATLILPLPAYADCADRIAAVENHPAIAQAEASPQADGGQGESSAGAGVRVDGGSTTHAQGGPATPSESWFTDSEDDDKPSALAHLDSARQAQDAGDERACIDAVEQAEAALKDE